MLNLIEDYSACLFPFMKELTKILTSKNGFALIRNVTLSFANRSQKYNSVLENVIVSLCHAHRILDSVSSHNATRYVAGMHVLIIGVLFSL